MVKVRVPLILAALAVASVVGATATPSLDYADVEAELVDPKASGDEVRYRIVSLRPAGGKDAPSIVVACPSPDLRLLYARIAVGDILKFDFVVVEKPNRKIYGSRDGQAELRVPPAGWPVAGVPARTPGTTVRIHGVLLEDDVPVAAVDGETHRRSWIRRIVPFRRGQTPKPPQRIRIRLTWDPAQPAAEKA